jgi:hypothetical protein
MVVRAMLVHAFHPALEYREEPLDGVGMEFRVPQSNGKLLELLRALKSKGGDRRAKLFQFLNDVGARALRMQIGRVLEMAEDSKDTAEYEARVKRRFAIQKEFDFTNTADADPAEGAAQAV